MISTHVLDTARGRPAAGVAVRLDRLSEDGTATELRRSSTDMDGRVRELLGDGAALATGQYRLTFDVGAYFARDGLDPFLPYVTIVFTVRDATQHHHVPLLVTPFGYTTYRGS
jgi:5-hydroxyisourate hydrolase